MGPRKCRGEFVDNGRLSFFVAENCHINFVGEKEERKRNVELHQMLNFFEILQGKKEEEIEMTAFTDSSSPSQVKAALLAQRRSGRMTLLISSLAS